MKRYRLWLIATLIVSVLAGGIYANSLRQGSNAAVGGTHPSSEPASDTKGRAAWGPARDGTLPLPPIAPEMGGSWWRAFVDLQHNLQSRLISAIRGTKGDNAPLASVILIGIAFVYGVMHAVGPGHGKAVIASYVLADGATLRRGIILSFLAALVQALTAIAVVWGTIILVKGAGADVRKMLQRFEAASGVLTMLAGGWLGVRHIQRRLRERRSAFPLAYGTRVLDHHNPVHDASCGCGHTHMPAPGLVRAAASWSEAAAIVLAIGIRPCTGAILLLVFALSQGLFWAGVGGTFAMALGTAMMVSVIACMTVGAREATTRMATTPWASRLYDIAIFAGALLLLALGLSLVIEAAGPVRPF